MAKSRLNIELFKKVRDRIKTIPESYDQRYWLGTSKRAPCGTVACLAGEAIICSAPSMEDGIRKLRRMGDRGVDIPSKAARLLGLKGDYWSLDMDQETAIFLGRGQGFPEPYRTDYRRARSRTAKAKVVVAFLDHVIEIGKVLE